MMKCAVMQHTKQLIIMYKGVITLQNMYNQTSVYRASICRASIYRAPLFTGAYSSPKCWVYVQSNVNSNSIYRAPLYTVLFCIPPRGTVNGGLTVLLETVSTEVVGRDLSWKCPTAEPRHVWRFRQNPSLLLEGKFCEDCC